eukprot:TRINITY_DN8386_c0_g1_i3.p1 TRINITY_DN8386_c0_g1~~TRINITY_DN8386_c0_g1_i3.p1  ORF type:complete len:187 (-),score=21.66 TRINITY_DN8386_c0_g1_i3:135-695(-)
MCIRDRLYLRRKITAVDINLCKEVNSRLINEMNDTYNTFYFKILEYNARLNYLLGLIIVIQVVILFIKISWARILVYILCLLVIFVGAAMILPYVFYENHHSEAEKNYALLLKCHPDRPYDTPLKTVSTEYLKSRSDLKFYVTLLFFVGIAIEVAVVIFLFFAIRAHLGFRDVILQMSASGYQLPK